MSEAQIQANTAEVTVTDADGKEWTFELVPTGNGPIQVSVLVDREQIEMPSDGTFRAFVGGPVHVSVKARGRLRSVTQPGEAPS